MTAKSQAGTSETPTAAKARSPEEIRKDIEETRGELGDTVEELAHKTDVKAQAKERVADVKQTVHQKREQLADKAKSVTPETARHGGERALAKLRENPIAVALGGAVLAGFLLGRRAAWR